MSSRAPTGRTVAARVLARVEGEGAWASRALDAEIQRARLSGPEAGRASDLVYGSLRALRSVDAAIDAQRTKPGALEPLARAVMRASAFELLFTTAPSHAVVSEAVELVKRERSVGLARFVNAVLRRIADGRPAEPRARGLELPSWVSAELERSLGKERAEAVLGSAIEVPPLGLRAYEGDASALAAKIVGERSGVELVPAVDRPRTLLARRLGDPRTLRAFESGAFAVQDVGSQRVAELVGAMAGETVLDACAGRGGKTVVLADAVGREGRVVAVDLHERKLEEIASELRRLHLPAPLETHVLDLSVGVGPLRPVFDRALVDVPCTGLGTLRRRPEILLRLAPADLERMAALELSIATRVAALVKPGGLVAVATCSFATAEGARLADRIAAALPALVRVHDDATDTDGVARIGPWSDPGSDVYQLVRFRVPPAA